MLDPRTSFPGWDGLIETPMRARTPRWQRRRQLVGLHVPEALRGWLFEQGSLTDRVRRFCPEGFVLELLRSTWDRPLPDERQALDLPAARNALVREVYLCCGPRPVVFARSVIPSRSLRGANQRLARLGARPLAAILFGPGTSGRRSLEVAALDRVHPLHAMATRGEPAGVLWARRSLFFPARKPILVTEVFLAEVATLGP